MKRNDLLRLVKEVLEEAVSGLLRRKEGSDYDTGGPSDTLECSERGTGTGRGERSRGGGGGRGRGRCWGGGRGGRRYAEEWNDQPQEQPPELELQFLREQAADFEQRLEWVRGRIQELEEGQQKEEALENP